jgi:hypothetical protein
VVGELENSDLQLLHFSFPLLDYMFQYKSLNVHLCKYILQHTAFGSAYMDFCIARVTFN